jgi:hypothetical protein
MFLGLSQGSFWTKNISTQERKRKYEEHHLERKFNLTGKSKDPG